MTTPGASGLPATRGLDEFATEAAPATPAIMMVHAATSPATSTRRAFCRVEAAHNRRARWSVAARMRRNIAAWRKRLLTAARAPSAPNPVPAASQGEVAELKSEGSFIAVALALAVVGYGGLLLMSWRDPLPRVSVAAAAPRLVTVAGASAPAPAVVALDPAAADPRGAIRAVTRAGSPATPDAGRFQPRVSAATLDAIWNRTDTRSLQGALTSLRHQTLAFHHCGMKLIGVDQAVARCEGSSRAYTIDFRRASGRWTIQRVSSR